MTSPALSPLLQSLTAAALSGGQIALEWFRPGERTSARIDSKEGGSPVTEADHAVDAFLRAELPLLLPEAGWLSEETVDDLSRLHREQVIIVDPIDGTRAFLSGDDRWGVCIAIVVRGRPVAGVVHMPALNQTFVAEEGGGAYRNGEPIRASHRAELTGASLAGPVGLLKNMVSNGLEARIEPKIPSLAYRFARVAEGSLDVGLASTNACDWDIAASDIILREAGGVVSDLEGQPPRYNRPQIRHPILWAASGELQQDLTTAMRRALSSTGK